MAQLHARRAYDDPSHKGLSQKLRTFEMYAYARETLTDEQHQEVSLSCKTMHRWLHSGYTHHRKKILLPIK